VRPFGVVLELEGVEWCLLGATGAMDRRERAACESAMYPLVHAILLRLSWMNALMRDTQAHPTRVAMREPVHGRRGAGASLSVRIARGRPSSRNARSKTRRATAVSVERGS